MEQMNDNTKQEAVRYATATTSTRCHGMGSEQCNHCDPNIRCDWRARRDAFIAGATAKHQTQTKQ